MSENAVHQHTGSIIEEMDDTGPQFVDSIVEEQQQIYIEIPTFRELFATITGEVAQ